MLFALSIGMMMNALLIRLLECHESNKAHAFHLVLTLLIGANLELHAQSGEDVYQTTIINLETRGRENHFFNQDFEDSVNQYVCLCKSLESGKVLEFFGYGAGPGPQDRNASNIFDKSGHAYPYSVSDEELKLAGNIRCKNGTVISNVPGLEETLEEIRDEACPVEKIRWKATLTYRDLHQCYTNSGENIVYSGDADRIIQRPEVFEGTESEVRSLIVNKYPTISKNCSCSKWGPKEEYPLTDVVLVPVK